MHISVVIPTRNRADSLRRALESVLDNRYSTWDVFVVDQSQNESTAEIVRGFQSAHAGVHYVFSKSPGAARARNVGARESLGEVLAFMDDDCVAPPDWISTIAHTFITHPDVDMVYGQVLRPVTLANSSGTVPTLAIPTERRLSRKDGFQIYGMTANMAVRRGLFDRVGGFDEILSVGGPLWSGEDFDFQYRIFLANGTILLSPELHVDHYGLRSDDEWPSVMRRYGIGDGAFYFKHIRLGDLFALRLFMTRLGQLVARELLSSLGIRKRSSFGAYLGAYPRGILMSMTFPIDPRLRLYRAPAKSSTVAT